MASTHLLNGPVSATLPLTADISSTDDRDDSELANQYRTPSPEPVASFTALKGRIRHHYELASDYYYSLWGEHIHHGYWNPPTSTIPKEVAQTALIDLLLERSALSSPDNRGTRILDVGCGLGGTARYLALNHGAEVLGITISGRQVEMAAKLSRDAAAKAEHRTEGNDGKEIDGANQPVETQQAEKTDGAIMLGQGSVHFLELDAETMGEYFGASPSSSSPARESNEDEKRFDVVWISEALSHLPDKSLFFRNAYAVLGKGGKLVIADWFKAEDLAKEDMEGDIKPIEDGMLLPPLCTQSEYVEMAKQSGFEIFAEPLDISQNVAKTWDLSWTLIQSPTLWAFAFSQGRDGIAFLHAFRAMKRGYKNGTFRYAVLVFQRRV